MQEHGSSFNECTDGLPKEVQDAVFVLTAFLTYHGAKTLECLIMANGNDALLSVNMRYLKDNKRSH